VHFDGKVSNEGSDAFETLRHRCGDGPAQATRGRLTRCSALSGTVLFRVGDKMKAGENVDPLSNTFAISGLSFTFKYCKFCGIDRENERPTLGSKCKVGSAGRHLGCSGHDLLYRIASG
jgi:hypothetical protein